jgi:subtilisin family serine protease
MSAALRRGQFARRRGKVHAGCLQVELDDHFATFSNYGAMVDIAAPAVCVTSTFPGGQYVRAEGTSFAASMVAGAAALLHARTPGISPAEVKQRIVDAGEQNTISGDPDAFPAAGRLIVLSSGAIRPGTGFATRVR